MSFDHFSSRRLIVLACLGITLPASASTVTLRVATYNIAADINGATTVNDAEMSAVLQGIGNENLPGSAHRLDILALEETTSNAVTVQPIANDLNTLYGVSTYTVPSFQATESDGDTADGNGPNAIIYNAATLQLLQSVGVGSPLGSTNGELRQVARYEFEPVGGTAAGAFYVYVCHAKSGSTSTDLTERNEEAQIIRANEALLPVNARVMYVGDFNIGSSTEASVQTLEAAGQGAAVDPINTPGNYANNSAFAAVLTESATDLRYRDDLQMVTQNVMSDATGLEYVPNSYTAFGNNGSVGEGNSVNSSKNTYEPALPNRATVLSDLSLVTDHLPVVADYSDVLVVNEQWNSSSGGTWNTSTNWTPAGVPNAQAAIVTLGSAPGLTAPAVITLDGSRTIGKLIFSNLSSYTVAAGTGGSLMLDDTGDPGGVSPSITVVNGSHVISAPITLAASGTFNIASGAGLLISGNISGAGIITDAGAGVLTFAPAATLGLALTVNGAVTFAANTSGGISTRTVPAISIGNGGSLALADSVSHANRTLLVTSGFTIASNNTGPAATLNLGGNDMLVHYGNLTVLNSLVKNGMNGGTWNGTGINSSTAQNDSTHLTAVGVIPNIDLQGNLIYGASPLRPFDGQTPSSTDVLLKYTYYGDANLDGQVDGSDYTLIDNAFNSQGASEAVELAVASTTAQAATVPEPAMLGLLATMPLLLRRRRQA